MAFTKSLSFETGPASPKTIAIGMAFVASVLLALATFDARNSYELDTVGVRTQGEVIQSVESGDDTQSAVFRFADEQGNFHTVVDRARSSYKRYDIGQKVPLVYSPNNPSGARKDGVVSIYLLPIIFGSMSVLFYGGAALVWRFRSNFQKDYEARRGRTIVTIVNTDGTVTQTTYSSVPVFRWTGIFLAGLGFVALLGALWLTSRGIGPDGQSLTASFLIYLVVLGGLLFVGAMGLLRHAKFLQNLEKRSDKTQDG